MHMCCCFWFPNCEACKCPDDFLTPTPPFTMVAILKAASTKSASGRIVNGDTKKLGNRA